MHNMAVILNEITVQIYAGMCKIFAKNVQKRSTNSSLFSYATQRTKEGSEYNHCSNIVLYVVQDCSGYFFVPI